MLGENIKYFRKKKAISQKELAKMIGKSYSIVQKYELGIAYPPISVLEKIAVALDVSIGELLRNEDMLPYDSELKKTVENAMQLMADQLPTNKLLSAFNKLNVLGQETAIERVEELTEIPKYTAPDEE